MICNKEAYDLRFGAIEITSALCSINENLTQRFGNLAIVELVLTASYAVAANAVVATMTNASIPYDSGKVLGLLVDGVAGGYAYTVQNTSNIYVSKAVNVGQQIIIHGVIVIQ